MTSTKKPVRPINRVFNALNRYSPILIQTPWYPSFGECGIEIRHGLLKAQWEGKRTLLVFHRHELFGRFRVPIANRELFLLESEHLYPSSSVLGGLAGWLLTAVFALITPWVLLWRSERLRRAIRRAVPWVGERKGPPPEYVPTIPMIGLSRLFQPDGTEAFSWEVVRDLRWSEQYARYRSPRLTESKRRSAERLRMEMGIPLSDWFVALHVREGGELENGINYRNSSAGNYVDAIRFITQAGGWVVRLGDRSITPLPDMERVIDYTRSRWKSELMDLYLISECRFFLGTTSGPAEVALLFDRPVLIVNAAEFSLWGPMRPGDLGILKHVYSPRFGRVLSVRELIEEPYESQLAREPSASFGYQLIENSPDEIRDVVEEYMRPERLPLSGLQRAFNTARSRAIHRWLDRGELKKNAFDREDELTEHYRLASVADDAAGSLGQKYLEQNWDAVPHWLTELPLPMRAPTSASPQSSAEPYGASRVWADLKARLRAGSGGSSDPPEITIG